MSSLPRTSASTTPDAGGLEAAARRSLMYQRLRSAFCYPGAAAPSDGTLGLPPLGRDAGAEFLAAFDPGVSADACSLHEAEYAPEDRTALFEELLRFYAFFGLAREGTCELPDHLTVELEFLHFLTFLEYQAAQEGRPVDGLRRAQYDFLSRHLARLARGIAERCSSPDAHYAALAAQLAEFVEKELRRLS